MSTATEATADLTRVLKGVAIARDGVIFRDELRRVGVTESQLRRMCEAGQLVRVHRGAYLVALEQRPYDEDLFRARVRALQRRIRRDEPVFVGPAALVVHGLPLHGPLPRRIEAAGAFRGDAGGRHLITPAGDLPQEDETVVDGRPVSTVARAVLDTARLHSRAMALAAADAALAAGRTTPEDLRATLARLRGRRGVEHARVVVLLASQLSESPGESHSRLILHESGFPSPQQQVTMRDDRGVIGRVDFWWEGPRVVGEFDGRVKYGRVNPAGRPPEDVLWEEKLREDRLRAQRCAVVRWTYRDLIAPDAWLRRLRAALHHP